MTSDFDLEEYFDSDAFLEQPFMQAFRREMERDKTLVSNPVQITKMGKAYRLIQQIIDKEMIDAKIEIEREELTHTDASIVVYVDSLEGSKELQTTRMLQMVLDLCDGYLILPTSDERIKIDLTFHNIMIEA